MQTRNQELGKLAAYEFEKVNHELGIAPIADYTSSVQRVYQRNAVISTLKPMMILLQIKFDERQKNDETKGKEFI